MNSIVKLESKDPSLKMYSRVTLLYPIDKTQFANNPRKVSERQKFVCGQTTLSF